MYQTPTPKKQSITNARSTSPFAKYHQKCVCEICNCNTHRCPRNPPYKAKIVPASHEDFKTPNNVSKVGPFKPRNDYTPTKADPNHFRTVNQCNYNNPPPNYQDRAEKVKKGGFHHNPTNLYAKAPGIYDTEYRQGVAKEKDYNYAPPTRPKEKPMKSMPFNGNSTYRDHYFSSGPLDLNTPIKAKDNILTDSKAPFNSKSHYRDEFVPYSIDRNNNYINRNKVSNIMTPERTEKPVSHYRDCFSGYRPEDYIKPECPMKYLPPPPKYLEEGKNHSKYDDMKNVWS